MKNILKAIVLISAISLFFASCTSRKQNCDAYGSIIEVEQNNTNEVNSTSTLILNKENDC